MLFTETSSSRERIISFKNVGLLRYFYFFLYDGLLVVEEGDTSPIQRLPFLSESSNVLSSMLWVSRTTTEE